MLDALDSLRSTRDAQWMKLDTRRATLNTRCATVRLTLEASI
jgi:hypothetical protein